MGDKIKMGVLDRYKQRKASVERRKNTKRANKLSGLRTERIRLEGKVKIINLEKQEKARIKKAKYKGMNPIAKKFSDNIKKNLADNKKKKNKKRPTVKSDYGKGVFW